MDTHNTQAMLDHTTTQDERAVETEFCVPFADLPIRTLTKQESVLLMGIIVQEQEGIKGDSIEEVYSGGVPDAIQMAQGALKSRFTFTLPDSILLLVCFTSKSIGDVIMYFTYLQYRAKLLNKRELSISDYVDIFPMGVPTDEALHKMWDSQKVMRNSETRTQGGGMNSDNLIDYPTATKSIQFNQPNDN